MTSTQFVTLVQTSERDTLATPYLDSRFERGSDSARLVGARWLRAYAAGSRRLARAEQEGDSPPQDGG